MSPRRSTRPPASAWRPERLRRQHDHALRLLSRPHDRARHDDRARDARARLDDRALPQHAALDPRVARRTAGPGSDHRPSQPGGRRPPAPSRPPATRSRPRPGSSRSCASRYSEGRPKSYHAPREAHALQVRALGQQRDVEIEHAVGGALGQPVEERRVHHVDAREHRDGAARRGRPARDREDPALPIADHRRVGVGDRVPPQRERRPRARRAVRGQEPAQVEVEEHVAVHEKERLVAEHLPHRPRTASRAQDRALAGVADAQAEAPSAPQDGRDGLRQVVQVHDDVPHSGPGEADHRPLEERAVEHRQHRLGPEQGQRAHPQAQARGEDHGLHSGKTMSPWPPPAKKSPT